MDKVCILLLSSVKFSAVFPLAVLVYQYSIAETILWTNIGGAAGVFIFCGISHLLIKAWNYIINQLRLYHFLPPKKIKRSFTRRNRFLIKIKNYGFITTIALTPVLFSIPVGSFLVMRFFANRKSKYLLMLISNLVWSVIYTSGLFLLKYKKLHF